MPYMPHLQYLKVSIGCDWGVDHSDEDGENYAAFVQDYLKEIYPRLNIRAEYDNSSQNDAIDSEHSGYSLQSIKETIQQAWEMWSDEGWPETRKG